MDAAVIENYKQGLSEKHLKRERHVLLQDIYNLYNTEQETILRRIENWKRYIAYCKKNRVPKGVASEQKFKFYKEFLHKITIDRGGKTKPIWLLMSHLKNKDLYFVLSVCRDKANRGES